MGAGKPVSIKHRSDIADVEHVLSEARGRFMALEFEGVFLLDLAIGATLSGVRIGV